LGLLSPLACGNLIGLGEYKADPDGSSADSGSDAGSGGTASSGGSNGSGGTGGTNTTGCTDDAADQDIDTGCNANTPMCETASNSCKGCLGNKDCDDGRACTTDTCDGGVCKATDDGLGAQVVLIDNGTLNGSYEDDALVEANWYEAVGWTETGHYDSNADGASQLTYNCSVACTTLNGGITAFDGVRIGWLGGLLSWSDRLVTPTFVIPDGATSLRFLIDTNFQTRETAVLSSFDSFSLDLVDDQDNAMAQIAEGSNLDAQQIPDPNDGFPHNEWTADGVDVEVNVQAGWAKRRVTMQISSTNDASDATDFVFDNIRVTATRVCD